MRRFFSVALLPALCLGGDLLDPARLESIHAQRVEWMKKRVVVPPQGVYRDYRAVSLGDSAISDDILKAARSSEVQILLRAGQARPEVRQGILMESQRPDLPVAGFGPNLFPARTPKDEKALQDQFRNYPDEVLEMTGGQLAGVPREAILRHASTHVLALELTPAAVEASIGQGRVYTAQDWLCDPAGFSFTAENNFGAYDIGDTVPLMKGTNLAVHLPVPGGINLIRDEDSRIVAYQAGDRLIYPVTETGSYHVQATLKLDGTDRTWIVSRPIKVDKPNFTMPVTQPSPHVEVRKDIAYLDDGEPKHKLDVYLPKGAKNFPVMVFLHGGSWRSGDRSQYPPFGDRFAKAGIGVVIPSYRLMPKNPYPAQIEDAAAAFAWTLHNIGSMGGDVSRIYVAGHSAGGHLASLLALDPEWLKKYDISPGAIHGVVSMSGVYDVDAIAGFKDKHASPVEYVHPRMPPFLVSYCQWDYMGLPKQARDFSMALKKEFGDVKLLYVPGQSHISEVIAALRDEDPLARAVIDFVK